MVGAVFPPKSFTVYPLLLITPCNPIIPAELSGIILLCPSSMFPSPQCWALVTLAFPSFPRYHTLSHAVPPLGDCLLFLSAFPSAIQIQRRWWSRSRIIPTSPSDVSSSATFLGHLPPHCSFVSSFPRTVFCSFMLLSQFGFTHSLGW